MNLSTLTIPDLPEPTQKEAEAYWSGLLSEFCDHRYAQLTISLARRCRRAELDVRILQGTIIELQRQKAELESELEQWKINWEEQPYG